MDNVIQSPSLTKLCFSHVAVAVNGPPTRVTLNLLMTCDEWVVMWAGIGVDAVCGASRGELSTPGFVRCSAPSEIDAVPTAMHHWSIVGIVQSVSGSSSANVSVQSDVPSTSSN